MSAGNLQKLSAWGVHLYTASGIIFGFLSLVEVNQQDWKMAMIWMIVCLFIDGTDGLLARKANVKEVLPRVNGKDIDFVIDFVTYALLPAYFFYHADLVPSSLRLILTAYILVISAIYYGIDGMVTDDMQFRGFPVLWNLVVFYQFFVFHSGHLVNIAMIILFGILHFIPIKISYPSKNLSANAWPMVVGLAAIAIFIAILIIYPVQSIVLTIAAWICMLFFAGLTIRYTWGGK